jgi:4-amino-4-deoxy-L-arabinose transferase-like glycosyltransferase
VGPNPEGIVPIREKQDARSIWLGLAGLIGAGLLLLLPGSILLPLVDRDEPKFARAAIEMRDRGDWVVPTFNGEFRPDKPPLTYWWMMVHLALLGDTELAVRLHSIIASILIALILYEFGGRLGSWRGGWWAGFGWLTCLQIQAHGRLAVADMPMVLAVAAAQRALCELAVLKPQAARSTPWALALWISLAVGFLAKGPVAWLVPALGLAAYRLLSVRPIPWRNFGAPWGVPLMAALVAAWGIPALLATQGGFWTQGMERHVVERGSTAFNGRSFIPLYYAGTVFLSLYPWSAFLPALVLGWWRQRKTLDPTRLFLMSWFLVPFVIFALYATQLPHYIMPGFPAFFLLLFVPAFRPLSGEWEWAGFWIVHAAMAATISTALALLALHGHMASGLAWAAGSLGAYLLAVLILGIAQASSRQRLGVAIAAAALMAVAFETAAISLRPLRPSFQLASVFRDRLPANAQRLGLGFNEPSLVYYLGGPWQFPDAKANALRDFLASNEKGIAVILENEMSLREFLEGRPGTPATWLAGILPVTPPPGIRIERIEGLDVFGRTKWVKLLVILKE